MDYTKKNPPDTNEGAAEVREPAVAYAYAPAGAVDGADWEDDLDDDSEYDANGDWFERRLKENPEYEEAVYRALEEARADVAAGRVYSLEDVFDELERDIRNGTI